MVLEYTNKRVKQLFLVVGEARGERAEEVLEGGGNGISKTQIISQLANGLLMFCLIHL